MKLSFFLLALVLFGRASSPAWAIHPPTKNVLEQVPEYPLKAAVRRQSKITQDEVARYLAKLKVNRKRLSKKWSFEAWNVGNKGKINRLLLMITGPETETGEKEYGVVSIANLQQDNLQEIYTYAEKNGAGMSFKFAAHGRFILNSAVG
jgi:hypothetical protein